MSKADNLKLSGTTKRKIGKKTIPEDKPVVKELEKKVKKEEPQNLHLGKVKKTNFELPEKIHFKAKVTAMELGKPLKAYITDLILDDLAKRGKI